MDARIELIGGDVLCRCPGSTPEELRIDGKQAKDRLEAWAIRYDAAVRKDDPAELIAVGRELFTWLDENGWASAWTGRTGPRSLKVRVDTPDEPLAKALLDVPWELLANSAGYLAADSAQFFDVLRRIDADGDALKPRHRDLHLMFMAAAPEGASSLDFEDEEAAILEATERLPLQLVVEESGAAEFLEERLALDESFDALHLSCHGTISPDRGPVLMFEDKVGSRDPVDARRIVKLLGSPEKTPLVFLSACRTAEQATHPSGEPFVRALVRAGVPNVLGWDGSVYDSNASAFATAFYRELAKYQETPRAAAVARQELLQKHLENPGQGKHWHLARLYVGRGGGGALAGKGLAKRKLAGANNKEQFLDEVRREVPVAKPSEFVGRRRQAQAVLRAFEDTTHAGALIHGMGNLGKSSLAARIASRMSGHKAVVVFRSYDALTVFDRIVEALPAEARKGVKEAWREAVFADSSNLGDALEAMLDGPLDETPFLLIVDDLERILEAPEQSDLPTRVQGDFRPMLAALLKTFGKVHGASKLLVTSRYRFSLSDGRGGDLAERLVPVPLQPMEANDRLKQFKAAAKQEKVQDPELVHTLRVQRALAVAGGNPGLQKILTQPLLAGETAAADEALAAIETFQETGVPPEEIQKLLDRGAAKDEKNAMVAFFKRMAFETYRKALTPDQATMLQSAGLFSVGLPIPRTALLAAGEAAQVSDPPKALDRLLGLGLADDWGNMEDVPYASANPLARPLVVQLDAPARARLAGAVLGSLSAAWMEADGTPAHDWRALELTRLALAAPAPDPAILNGAAASAARFFFDKLHDARQALEQVLQPVFAKLEGLCTEAAPKLLMVAFDCTERLGEREEVDRVLGLIERIEPTGSDGGSLLLRRGRAMVRQGQLEEAQRAFERAAGLFGDAGAERDRAIAQGDIADILTMKGELDEALRIRTEDQLPVYERLEDVREKAMTQGKIADILMRKGELDEALRILTEDQLPVFERLEDVRSVAVTQGKIADILMTKGELDEALCILTEDQLPVYERLEDVRSVAVTQGKIADILETRGELDEALRIHTEEELPVFKRLGDVRSVAVTQGQIADILMRKGELDEALRIRTEEVLPVYKRLKDVRSVAVNQGKIADILMRKGELDEALRIWTEDQLPVYERLGDVREKAVVQGNIADNLEARGELDEALSLHQQRLDAVQSLGMADQIAHAKFSMAKIRILREEHKSGGIQQILEDMAESFKIVCKLGRPDGIAMVGIYLGQILAMGGKEPDALEVLDQAAEAFQKMGDEQGLAMVRQLQDAIRENMKKDI